MLEMFGKYQLKDGTSGWIVDVLGDGKEYIFELDKEGLEDRIISITPDQIEKKLQ